MKRIFLLVLVLTSFELVSHAQIAFVDTRYILNKMPSYRDSVAKINQLGIIWQKEIDDKQVILDKMINDFERDEVMLSDSIKKDRSNDLYYHQKEVRDLQRMRFGYQGDLFKKKQELLKPIEDSVNNIVKQTAARLNYKIVLDKSQGITVMFANPKLDITDEVLKDLGMQ
ncbi:MAG TPA: OmpH family outer membrane protein [Puia sp.]|jgi:outer membrane protein|nr:OmpH family outer membrane protein [Puia sp.]